MRTLSPFTLHVLILWRAKNSKLQANLKRFGEYAKPYRRRPAPRRTRKSTNELRLEEKCGKRLSALEKRGRL